MSKIKNNRKGSVLTSVVHVVNDVEVVLHGGAVSAAEAGGEEEQQHHSRGQPAARQDAAPRMSRCRRQHALESVKALLGGWRGQITVLGHARLTDYEIRRKNEADLSKSSV